MSHDRHRTSGGILLVGALAASMTLGAGVASAGRTDPPGRPDANHCVNEFGVDLNELYGVDEQFRVFECRTISAGERWIPWVPWITDDAADNLYPADYVPSEPAPMDDFLSKLVGVTVIIDGGTAREKTYRFDPDEAVRTDVHAEEINPGAWGAPYPVASIMPTMPPIAVGQHTYEVVVELSAQHCDGFGTDPELQCLPEGETSFTFVRPLTISPPER